MSNRKLFIIVIAIIIGGFCGVYKTDEDFDVIDLPFKNVIAEEVEGKGCLSCYEGIDVINDKMQPFLLSFAKKRYGREKPC